MGQRNRFTIGIELSARPELLLILDEPTSGLGSDTAVSICMLLRKFANSRQAILCTIHQPSATLFEIFDRHLLLADGGRMALFGSIGTRSETVIRYFEEQGARSRTATSTPAGWIIDTICDECSGGKPDWTLTWQESAKRHLVKQQIPEMTRLHLTSSRERSPISQPRSSPFAAQLLLVLVRLFQKTPSSLDLKMFRCIGSVSISHPYSHICGRVLT